ncbi:phosphoribosyltransferase family protein [Kitasatospora sp. NPDC004799]|uniref:phosphoribosyltransferase family protein n=1 Tax=Kitasatospora sp. NPDC004799 TaxID=3154460 RepID=UPI0033B00286
MRTQPISIGDVRRELPVVAVSDTVSIAFLKLYGDVELVDAATAALADRLRDDVDIILGPESGGILLAHKLAEKAGKPYRIARKKVRPNMAAPLRVPVQSIGTAGVQELVLGEDDAAVLRGRRIAVIDEVISSGGTLAALDALVGQAGGEIVQVLAVATEGDERPSVTSLLHLPLYPNESAA